MGDTSTFYRTHTCGELRIEQVGQTVTLAGWMENLREVGQNLAFLVLRDFYGTTQVVLETEETVQAAKDLNKDRHNGGEEGAPELGVSADSLVSAWYVRAQVTVDEAKRRCGEIQLLARSGAPAGEAAFLTAPMTEPEIQEKLAGMEVGSRFRVLA